MVLPYIKSCMQYVYMHLQYSLIKAISSDKLSQLSHDLNMYLQKRYDGILQYIDKLFAKLLLFISSHHRW